MVSRRFLQACRRAAQTASEQSGFFYIVIFRDFMSGALSHGLKKRPRAIARRRTHAENRSVRDAQQRDAAPAASRQGLRGRVQL